MTGPLKLTDAQVQAYGLYALADHLSVHPGLPPVHVSPWRTHERTRIRLCATSNGAAAAMLMWAGSLGVDTLSVQRPKPFGAPDDLPRPVELHAVGRVTGQLAWGHRYVVQLEVIAEVYPLTTSSLADGDQLALADLMVACAQPGDLAAALAAVQGGEQL